MASELDPEYRKGYKGGWNDCVSKPNFDPKSILAQEMDDDSAQKVGRRHAIRDFVTIRDSASV